MIQTKTNFDPEQRIWYGNKTQPIFSENVSVGQIILSMLERDSDKVVQISANNEVQFTGRELADLSVRMALNLQKKGLQQDDNIGIIASNTQYLSTIVFGALLCGMPFNTLDVSFDKNEIKHMFGITRPKIIFCDADNYHKVQEAIKEISLDCPIYTVKGKINGIGTIEEDFLRKTGEEDTFLPPKLKNGGDQIAAILCSSGTTGLPKGVRISHRILLNQTIRKMWYNMTTFSFSPLYWLSGVQALILGTISGSKRIITDEPFSPELLLKVVEKYQVTFIITPPSQMALTLNCHDLKTRDLSSIKLYVCGGSAVPVAGEMQTYLPNGDIIIGYGMTELAGLVCYGKSRKRIGSVGQLEMNIQMKIIDENGKNLDVGQDGEILIKTPTKCLGYLNNLEATKDTIDDDGWVHSGDIGHFDNDGYLFITDRKKEILKYKGYQFYPTEIEEVVIQIPGVIDACVCGIPDVVATDLPAVAIIKKDDSDLTCDKVYDYVASKLANFKHLRGGVYFFDSLPMTPSGKIQRRKVRDILEKLRNEVN